MHPTLQSAPDPFRVLRRAFGYESFRPGQEELVRAVLDGRDALGVLPTGGGKSVCYQVPAFLVDGLTLVVTPLVSLMEDQVQRARDIGLRADCLTGTQPTAFKREVAARVRSGATRLLFVSPERLELARFRTLLRDVRVGLVAVDEAHCISEDDSPRPVRLPEGGVPYTVPFGSEWMRVARVMRPPLPTSPHSG